jgi:dienelactone hydrolase
MTHVTFDDLWEIRKGGPQMTMGSGPTHVGRIKTAAEWEIKRGALREIFLQTLGAFPEISCPLSPEALGEEDCREYVKRMVAYSLEPDERITAYVLIPKGLKGRAPAVLCLHPTTSLGKEQAIGNDPSEQGQDRAYALHLVRRGYVTLAYDLLSAGERRYEGRDDFDTAPFYARYPQWSVRGKDLWDVSRALDYLQTLDEVDPGRIGSLGHSQGGGITIHAMVFDERIQAGVSSCGAWPDRLSRNPFNNARTGWWVGRPFLRPYCYTGKPFPVDLHELLAVIAPRSIMNISALNDWQYTLEEEPLTRPALENLADNVSGIFSLLGTGGNFRNLLHTRGHGFEWEQREAAYAFLDENLRSLP